MTDKMMNRWSVPHPYGAPKAMEAMGTVAAPLLAAGALGLLGLVLQVEVELRWPSLALLLLVASAISLVLAVQATNWMRQYDVTPSELREWHDDADSRLADLRDIQWTYQAERGAWENRARRAYQFGIVVLFAGVAVVLVPRGDIDLTRGIAIVAATIAAVSEAIWSTMMWLFASRFTRRIHNIRSVNWMEHTLRHAPEWRRAPREVPAPPRP
jgi:hypothetical protein